MTELIFNVDAEKEFDDKDNAWKYYQKKYKIDNKQMDINGKKIKVNGECVFNFGTRYKKLRSIIDKDKNIEDGHRQVLIRKLDICRNLHHSLPNIMVLPECGGLNTLKGEIYFSNTYKEWRVRKGSYRCTEWFDRPDSLVCYINEYYSNKQKQRFHTFLSHRNCLAPRRERQRYIRKHKGQYLRCSRSSFRTRKGAHLTR